MTGSRAAVRYAKATLELAMTQSNAEQVLADMNQIHSAIVESKELKLFLENPIINGQIKLNAINEIFASVQKETKGLFQLLHTNKRFSILDTVALQFTNLYNKANGIEQAVVTTAIPLTADVEAKVIAKAKEFSNQKVTLTNKIDPSIIGGFILRVGDKQYNASVAHKLQELKREFSN